ncbi:hypothetical protein CHS0354_005911, partial [Potamilus streckersoni]
MRKFQAESFSDQFWAGCIEALWWLEAYGDSTFHDHTRSVHSPSLVDYSVHPWSGTSRTFLEKASITHAHYSYDVHYRFELHMPIIAMMSITGINYTSFYSYDVHYRHELHVPIKAMNHDHSRYGLPMLIVAVTMSIT